MGFGCLGIPPDAQERLREHLPEICKALIGILFVIIETYLALVHNSLFGWPILLCMSIMEFFDNHCPLKRKGYCKQLYDTWGSWTAKFYIPGDAYDYWDPQKNTPDYGLYPYIKPLFKAPKLSSVDGTDHKVESSSGFRTGRYDKDKAARGMATS